MSCVLCLSSVSLIAVISQSCRNDIELICVCFPLESMLTCSGHSSCVSTHRGCWGLKGESTGVDWPREQSKSPESSVNKQWGTHTNVYLTSGNPTPYSGPKAGNSLLSSPASPQSPLSSSPHPLTKRTSSIHPPEGKLQESDHLSALSPGMAVKVWRLEAAELGNARSLCDTLHQAQQSYVRFGLESMRNDINFRTKIKCWVFESSDTLCSSSRCQSGGLGLGRCSGLGNTERLYISFGDTAEQKLSLWSQTWVKRLTAWPHWQKQIITLSQQVLTMLTTTFCHLTSTLLSVVIAAI